VNPDAPQNPPAPSVSPAIPGQPATASAPIGPAGQGKPPEGGWVTMLPILLMLPLMYFLFIRPQQKQQKKRKAELEALKKNDQVLTIGGIYGTILAVSDDQVTLKIDEAKDVRIRIARGSVQGVVKTKASASEGSEAS